MIRIARHFSWTDQFKFVVLGLATIYEGLIMVCSLGFLTTEARGDLLFSDWFDEAPPPPTAAIKATVDALNRELGDRL